MASSSGRKRKANETEKLLDSFQERIIDLELENQYLSERVKLLEEENRQSRLKIDDEKREKREQIETNDALVKINLALENENGRWSRSYAVVLAKLKDVTNGNPSSIEGPVRFMVSPGAQKSLSMSNPTPLEEDYCARASIRQISVVHKGAEVTLHVQPDPACIYSRRDSNVGRFELGSP
ncbi:hypothetical protein R1sor_020598 [Riccia sorocarpa]|uniref:Uncharacterized protein n=1 Tax=Riccia sorocarpa TaxID=122646 RepID=A0ABD3IGK2_9MARC